MKNPFFEGVTVVGFTLCALAALGFLVFGQWPWSLGVMVSAFWMFLNSYFLFQLLEIALDPKSNRKNKIPLLTILKFPVLYLAGFFVLKSRFFPVYSILAGLTLFMIAFTLMWVRMNFSGKKLEGKAL